MEELTVLSFEKIKFHNIPSIGTIMERLKSRHTLQDLPSLITRVEGPIYTDVIYIYIIINRHSKHGKKRKKKKNSTS